MADASILPTSDDEGKLRQVFVESSDALMEALKNDNTDEALVIINHLVEVRDQDLFRKIGKLTRAVHDSLKNFYVDADEQHNTDQVHLSGASQHLSYVTELTERAANQTMDLVEQIVPITEELSGHVERLTALCSQSTEAPEVKHSEELLEIINKKIAITQQHLNSILLAQDYQDLTGQVVKRLDILVKDVECSLVDLVRMASQVEKETGIQYKSPDNTGVEKNINAGFGPQINPNAPDVVASQDDVDDLLSSLGF